MVLLLMKNINLIFFIFTLRKSEYQSWILWKYLEINHRLIYRT